jgi:hypothetical protein
MKQYLMLCDENGLQYLRAILRPETIQFLEVQGMNVGTDNKFNVLVTPVLAPVPPVEGQVPPEPVSIDNAAPAA